MLSDEDLAAMYKNNFLLTHVHKYSFEELDNMMPYEREIYISLFLQREEKKKRINEYRETIAGE